jgi:hypothetical protein
MIKSPLLLIVPPVALIEPGIAEIVGIPLAMVHETLYETEPPVLLATIEAVPLPANVGLPIITPLVG